MKLERCHVHAEQSRPCAKCDRIFTLAKLQRTEQHEAEQREAHERYLTENPGERAKAGKRFQREQKGNRG
jgi:hypothetical protein